MTCHNYARYLREAVESALANDVDLAVTIVDDASVDETAAVAAELAEGNRRVSYMRHRRRTDVSAARNDGIAARDSQYVCMLDADDRIGPDYLQEAEKLLLSRADCACPDMRLFGNVSAIWRVPDADISALLLERNRIPYCSAFARNWWSRLRGFDEQLANWQDYDFWLRMRKAGARFQRLPGEHFYYRQHGPSKSLKPGQHGARAAELWHYLRLKHPDLPTLGQAACPKKTGNSSLADTASRARRTI